MIKFDSWCSVILADPISKLPVQPDHFSKVNGVLDARVFLRNTHGYDGWAEGQTEYEQWTDRDKSGVDAYRKEIAYDRPIYEHYTMGGRMVHMRSMLDHVQVVDLALLEARRVLKPGGHVLIGLYVEGGKSGVITLERRIKNTVKAGLELIGIDRWKDHHVWHPTYAALTKLIQDNGFAIEDTFWQPHWNDTVCYVSAVKG